MHKELKLTRLTCYISFAVILFWSCNSQHKMPDQDRQGHQNHPEYYSQLLTEVEASRQAIDLYHILFPEHLRADDNLSVQNVTKIDGSRLRSGIDTEDEDLYIVNFKDDRGYVILSENQCGEPIIGASHNGHIDTKTEIENANIVPVLANIETVIRQNGRLSREPANGKDFDHPIPCPHPEIDDFRYEFGEWETLVKAEPLIKVKWHQRSPFNDKLDLIEGSRPPAGCVAIAVSQIMSFHKHPSYYNWDLITKNIWLPYSKEALATLHKDLGSKENLDMNYKPSGSGAPSSNVPRTFRNYGYRSGEVNDYSWESIKSEIFAQRPVYISAFMHKHTWRTRKFLWWGGKLKTSYSGGHAWVLDGVLGMRREVRKIDNYTNEVLSVSYQKKEMVHCNFGWGGYQDGYYLNKAFDTNKGPEQLRSSENNIAYGTYGEDYNFQFNMQIITGIER